MQRYERFIEDGRDRGGPTRVDRRYYRLLVVLCCASMALFAAQAVLLPR